MFLTSLKQTCNEYLIKFSENQSAPKLENRKTSPCSPCALNLLHLLVSRIPGYHNLCSPVSYNGHSFLLNGRKVFNLVNFQSILSVTQIPGWHEVAVREVERLGAALARQSGQDEDEAVRHLWGKLAFLLQRGNSVMLGGRGEWSECGE